MSGKRRLHILTLLGTTAPTGETKRLCEVSAEVTGMTGAGIMLMSGDVPRGSICTTNDVSALIEQLQYELGEGPCVDAYNHDRPVLEPNLVAPHAPRWLGFRGPAIDAGVKAVFGFPLQVGSVRLGALNLYCDKPGHLTDEQHADALTMADIAAQAVLVMQAKAEPGQLALELEVNSDFQYVVHQAAGMVAAQLDISVALALIRIRAYAFGNELSVSEVARKVVGRTLRFEAHDDFDASEQS